MPVEERTATFECTSLTRVILTSHTKLRGKLSRICKIITVAFAGVANGGHQKVVELVKVETSADEYKIGLTISATNVCSLIG